MQLDGLKILLAEDSPGNRLVAQRMLESLGAVVSAVEDGAGALERAGTERFDVALIDIGVPEVSGLEVIRRLRAAAPDGRGPAVIALTASGGPARHAEIVTAGAAGVIPKLGLSPEGLGRDIRRLMARTDAPPSGSEARKAEIDPVVYDALSAAVGGAALGDFLATVEEDVAAAGAELVAAAGAGDMAGVRRAAHVLIGVAGAIGAVGLQRLAERLNQTARAADAARVTALAAEAHAEAARLAAFLSRAREECREAGA